MKPIHERICVIGGVVGEEPETMNTYKFIYVAKPVKCNCPVRQEHKCDYKQNEEVVKARDSMEAFQFFNIAMQQRRRKLHQEVSKLLDVQVVSST